MAHDELKHYIKHNINAGHHPKNIKKALVEHGHHEHHVDEAMKSVAGEKIEGGNNMAEVNMSDAHYGGFWMRFVAAILDGIIIGIPANILSFALVAPTGIVSLSYVVNVLVVVFVIYMDGIKGGTPGKLILGMRIVNEHGNFIGIPGAILRYIGKIISGLILGIGYFMIGFTEKKQGLHDYIAKTFVVYKK